MQDEKLIIYIIDKDIQAGKQMAYHLNLNPDWKSVTFPDMKEFFSQDLPSPDMFVISGCENIKELVDSIDNVKEYYQNTKIVCISGSDKKCISNLLLDPAVFDVVLKDDLWLETLWHHTRNIHQESKLRKKFHNLQNSTARNAQKKYTIIGESHAMQPVFNMISKAAQSDITCSIVGDTGTGKELVAKNIHYHSERKNHPLIAINVSAIPKDLVESEFFGYEKGAFTGAATRRIGKLEEANHGTLFLDEIADMDINMQAKLLRVLQEKEFSRLGSNSVVKFDARIICATHKNLATEVEKGNFREDLYYRLLGLTIQLPPLCNRGQDVILLANHFIKTFARENHKSTKTLHRSAEEKLLNYAFPGNIRELKAIIDLSMVMAGDNIIYADDISLGPKQNSDNFLGTERTLKEYSNLIVKYFMEKYDHKIAMVAQKLDIGKSTLYRMLQEEKK